MDSKNKSYFSISSGLVLINEPIPYDLYINSSSHAIREKFVKIYGSGNALTKEELNEFRDKYFQLYVSEEQRNLYLSSLNKLKDVEDITKVEVIKDSAIEYLGSLFDGSHEFTNEVLDEALEGCKESVESMVDVIKDYGVTEVQKLIGDLSFHDFYTYDHSINVSMYSISILKALKPEASKTELIMAGMGGLLHDLGKIKIPTRIINNPGKLSDEDFAVIRKHPDYGTELLSNHDCSHHDVNFDVIKRVIGEHHENYNGTGYPNQLKGKDISVFARITAIADFYDAITTKRSYHEVLSTEDALEVMARSVGRKIDPKIFEVFRKNVNVILTGKSHREVADDFDPCQPSNILHLEKAKPKVQRSDFLKKDENNFGTVVTNKDKKKAS